MAGGIWLRSRAAISSAFRLAGNLPNRSQPFAADYHLDSSTVDVRLARSLYNNTEPRYKLGAGFSRAAINVPVGFMGVPILRVQRSSNTSTATDSAQDEIDRMLPQWAGQIRAVHKAVLLDGEALVRIRPANRSPAYSGLFSSKDKDIEIGYEPSESFEVLHMDEDIGAIEGVRVKHLFYVQEGGQTVERALWETVTADQITLEYESNWKPKRTFPNPLGWVPAVYISNESARHELRGRSELEALEPYMKFYHDVMLHAGAASKLHSTAKLILRVQDVNKFLENNFTEAEVTNGVLTFKDKDVLFFETGAPEIGITGSTAYAEGADIIQARAPLGDTNTLLEYIFLNIVDASEVPEWAFGGAIASSKASVSEQSAPLVHKIHRKRSLFENSWIMAARMALTMLGQTGVQLSAEWDDLATKDTKAESEALKARVEALVALNDAETISKQSIVEELRPYLPKVLPYSFDNSRDEKTRLEDEIEERDAKFADSMSEQEGDGLDQEDRAAGLRAIG